MRLGQVVALVVILLVVLVLSIIWTSSLPSPEITEKGKRVVSTTEEFIVDNVTLEASVRLLAVDGDLYAGRQVQGSVLIVQSGGNGSMPASVSHLNIEILFENAARGINQTHILLPSWLEVPGNGEGVWKIQPIFLVIQSSGPCSIQLRAIDAEGHTTQVQFKQPIVAESFGAYLDLTQNKSQFSYDLAIFILAVLALFVTIPFIKWNREK